ncbi:MAG: glycosyltransferase [Chloroflexi bacterium]|nr:glycosyltransferase [Chloroflexota bacterium]MCL5075300.1 glycosyltransferase [Chloroflexota bacterium]
MSLKFLIVDTYYPVFLRSFYTRHPGLAGQPYAEQWRTLMDQCFGTADFYSLNLKKLDCEAEEVVANCVPLQQRWAYENQPRLAKLLPIYKTLSRVKSWQLKVLVAQIEKLRPDILYIQNLNWVDDSWLRAVRSRVRLVVGQTAYPLRDDLDYRCYDLILTSFPHYVDLFRRQGVSSEYLRLAFEPEVLKRLGSIQSAYDTVFVGGYTGHHRAGSQLLEQVARKVPLDFWGYGTESLPKDSPIRQRYHGEAWGLDMYRILAQAKITLNRHIDVADRYANNMRLYEATGVGTLLVTDSKDNLHDLFEPGKEVLSYRDPEECVELIRYYLEHENERAVIAAAGQARTLREHTYYHRMRELVDIIERYVEHPERATRRVVTTSAPLCEHQPSYVQGPSPGFIGVAHAAQALIQPLRPLLARLPGQRYLRLVWHRLRGGSQTAQPVSYGHRTIPVSAVTHDLVDGWKDPAIPPRQRNLVESELRRMYQGDIVPVYRASAEALLATGMSDSFIVEVGCASGYYYEVLSHLLRRKINYLGIDYSPSLIAQARQFYPHVPFLVGDATKLPLADQSCDILLSGTVLLHVPEYEKAIQESARVARYWCVFHRTPVVKTINTTYLSKFAYGVQVVELVFDEEEILSLFAKYGLKLHIALDLDSYYVEGVKDKVAMKTYVCRKVS